MMKPSDVLMLMGDFNTPTIRWSQSSDGGNGLIASTQSGNNGFLTHGMALNGLVQILEV